MNKAGGCAKFTSLLRNVFNGNELTTIAAVITYDAATTYDVADWAGMRSCR